MRPPALALAASLAALGAGMAIIPGPLERVTMLTRDRQFEAALHLANGFLDAGKTRPELLMQAFLLNERYGDLPRAKEAIRAYLALRPDDVEGWRKAAWLYANAHRSEPLMEALENIVRLTADADAAHRLARLYRLHARFDDELRALQAIDADALGPEHAMRLASLLIAKGHKAAAGETLRRLDETLASQAREPRLLLFDVLVDSGDFEEAADRALGWLEVWRSADARASFARQLLRAGADEAALRLASHADGSVEPEVLVYLMDVLTQEGRLHLLRDLLGAWIGHARALPPARLDAHLGQVVAVAAERGLEAQLFLHLDDTLRRHDLPDLQAGLVNAMFDRLGHTAIMPHRAALTPAVLESRPVLAARLLAAEGNPHAARHFLLRARLTDASGTGGAWLAVAQTVMSPAEILHELVARARSDDLPQELVRPALDLAARMGGGEQLREIWTIAVHGAERDEATDISLQANSGYRHDAGSAAPGRTGNDGSIRSTASPSTL